MRKTFTFFAFAMLGLGLQAQLTRADFPNVGDSQVYRKADTTGVTPGPSGTGQTWNFGSLVNTAVVATNAYIAPASHAQGSNFPTADLCYKPFNDDYKFYETSADSMYLIGEKSVANTRCTYTDGAALYRFPQAFNVANVDSVHGEYPDGFISNITRKGWYQTKFDADGQLTTPYMTFNGVKRVEITAYFEDSSWTGAANGQVYLTRYEWYAPSMPMPVMINHTLIFVLNGGNPTVTHEIWYADPNAVSTTEGAFANMGVYPNPTDGNSQLSYRLDAEDQVEVELLSIMGQRIKTIVSGSQAAGNHQFDLGTDKLASGIYLVRLTSSQGSVTRKLVVE